MTDSPTMIQLTIIQPSSPEIQLAERRLTAQLARLEARAASDRFDRGSDQSRQLSWWRYY
jgi:hypothetical protein